MIKTIQENNNSNYPLFSCSNTSDLKQLMPQIVTEIETKGFSLLDGWDTETETLKSICQHFGYIQHHIRGDENGVVNVAYQNSWDQRSQQDKTIQQDEFQTYSAETVKPHTDGAVIDGILVNENQQYVRVLPPNIVLFQCVKPAESGGELLLVDAQQILIDLLTEKPDIISILLKRGSISFCRDDQLALDQAVFNQIYDDNLAVRIHFDGRVLMPKWSYDAIKIAYEEYFAHPKYSIKIPLKSKQILIIDNCRMLHGRAKYQVINNNNMRWHRRVWLSGEPLILKNAQNKVKQKRAFECYSAYQSINVDGQKPYSIKCGTKLDSTLKQNLQTILNS